MDSPAVTEPALREEPVQSTGPEAGKYFLILIFLDDLLIKC